MSIFNQFSLSVMGIMFDLLGSFILTLEAFGLIWTENFFKKLIQFSKWAKSSLIKLLIILLFVLSPILLQIVFESKILNSLFLPIATTIVTFSFLLDDAEKLRDWTVKRMTKNKITPIGFIMIVIGSLLQLIGTIMQIK